MSVGSEDDVVIVPNIPMLSATSQSKHAARYVIFVISIWLKASNLYCCRNCRHRFLRLAMASIMDILKIKPFVEVSVGQLLWGYEDPLLKLAKDVVPKEQKLPYEEFGLMYGKNSTSPVSTWRLELMFECFDYDDELHMFCLQDRVTVFTGVNDITKFGIIDKFNGNSQLAHWTKPECNRLNGSDGSIFPPHIAKTDMIHVYDKDLCRLLPLSFEKEVSTNNNVLGYRFTPDEKVFASVENNPDNVCFCPAGPPCAPHGMFNVSLCQFGKSYHHQNWCLEDMNIQTFHLLCRLARSAQFPTFLFGRWQLAASRRGYFATRKGEASILRRRSTGKSCIYLIFNSIFFTNLKWRY